MADSWRKKVEAFYGRHFKTFLRGVQNLLMVMGVFTALISLVSSAVVSGISPSSPEPPVLEQRVARAKEEKPDPRKGEHHPGSGAEGADGR